MSTGEIIALASASVAALALIFNMLRTRSEGVSDTQAIRDKLEYISDTTRDTREDVRALDRKMDDHAARIAKIEQRTEDHERRLEKLEG